MAGRTQTSAFDLLSRTTSRTCFSGTDIEVSDDPGSPRDAELCSKLRFEIRRTPNLGDPWQQRANLLAIAIFVNGAKGHSALQLREAMGSEVYNPDQAKLSGTLEIDDIYVRGNTKPANKKAERIDRRRAAETQTGKRQWPYTTPYIPRI